MAGSSTLSEEPVCRINPALLPTEEDVLQYEATGWFVTKPVIPSSLLDVTRQAIDSYHSGMRDYPLSRSAQFSDWQPGDGDGVRNNEFCSLQSRGIRELVLQPIIGAIAARLARSPSIRLFDDQAIYKPPASGSPVGWHTDHSYWSTCTSERMLTAWIPLHDANEDNGTLYVVSGSHRWPEAEHLRGFNDADLAGLSARLGRPVPDEIVIPIELKKGQISFHHMRALHASAVNRTTHARYAVAAHLQDHSNRYRQYTDATGRQVVLPHDCLCARDAQNLPDYSDPETFPVIWEHMDVSGPGRNPEAFSR